MTDWEQVLRDEGMPPEPPARRARPTPLKERRPGNDPQPLREVSYEAYDNWRDAFPYTRTSNTELEAMMVGEEDSLEAQERRFFDMVNDMIEDVDHPEADMILSYMSRGIGAHRTADELSLPRQEVIRVMADIRAFLRERYGLGGDGEW